jgi:predicted phage terminase large subunit-like protein
LALCSCDEFDDVSSLSLPVGPGELTPATIQDRLFSSRRAIVESSSTASTVAPVHAGVTGLSWSEYVAELETSGAGATEEHGLWCEPDCPCGFSIPEDVEASHPLLGLARQIHHPAIAAMFLQLDDADAMLYGQGALHRFLIGAWPEIEPGTAFEDGELIEAVCDHLQRQLEERAVAHGAPAPEWLGWTGRQRAQNLLIRQPPRTLKTVISTIAATAWAWLRWPTMRILSLSSNPRVTSDSADRVRSLVRSAWYQHTFSPKWSIREDMDALTKLGNSAGGWRAARGMQSRITGEGCDWMLIDDPHDGGEVYSKAKRQAVLSRWENALKSRLNNLGFDIRTGVMQGLHFEDWGEKRIADGWGLLLIRMEYEPTRPRKRVGDRDVYIEPDDVRVSPYGWRDWRTEIGQSVSLRWTAAVLAAEKINPLVWSAQYQQDPAPIDGGMIKSEVLCTYEELPSSTDGWAITVDAAFKKKPDGSRVSVQVWCRKGPDRYLVDNDTRPMHLEETIDSIKAMRDKWPQAKGTILIEDKANGSEIIRRLKEVMPGVIAVNPGSNSKEGRLEACLAYFYGRNVYIPRNAPWREDLVAEWTQFPNWPKDDQVDAAVQVLLYWRLSNAAQRARSGCTL